MDNVRGSRWHKWDFHVHTPYSVLNNRFGIDPLDESSFDDYVRQLYEKAVSKEIAAIGITDYFSIDGYKRLRNEYLNSDESLAKIFPDEEKRSAAQSIFVFPNVEFRTNDFVGESSHSLNYHVIFSDEVLPDDIELYFLQELHFITGTGEKRPLSRQSIIELGVETARNRGDNTKDYYRLGLELVTVDRSEIRKVLDNCERFKNKYLITVPVDEDLSEINWAGRDYTTRREIYYECDCYMTSNSKTRKWALASGEERERIKEFRSIKPCIWGSDAHDFESLFEPSEHRYCWVKADATFEGMKQMLIEPGERVRIQREGPFLADQHKVIESLIVNDLRMKNDTESAFQRGPIQFNEGLTCIIGGKSTGKSLLLRTLAYAIDRKYAMVQERGLGISTFPEGLDAEVAWADGTSERRRFIYIPQSYLNRLVDDPQHRTQIDDVVEGILLQDPARSVAYDELNDTLTKLKGKVFTIVKQYCELRDKRSKMRRLIDTEGSADVFSASIANLEHERDAIAKEAHITESEVMRYEELGCEIDKLKAKDSSISESWETLRNIPCPTVVIPGYFSMQESEIVHSFTGMSPDLEKEVSAFLEEERRGICERWDEVCRLLLGEVAKTRESIKRKTSRLETERAPLRIKVEQSEMLSDITNRLDEERRKEVTAKEREDTIEGYEHGMQALKQDLLNAKAEMLAAIKTYCSIVNDSVIEGTSLEFEAQPVWRQDDFISTLLGQVDNRGLSQFRLAYGYDLREIEEADYEGELCAMLWKSLENPMDIGGLSVKGSNTFDSVLRSLFDNWYNVHYIVRSDGDEMDSMSPGKRGLAMLELIIDLDREMCPLLIDQPEDDLDNRSVYNELVSYLRRRKEKRQIIVVTHNANVVLGTDAEEIILANQHGAGTRNADSRFEYRSGSIEDDRSGGDDSRGILYQRGLQSQMCDILEGGLEALERRRKKYTSASLDWSI